MSRFNKRVAFHLTLMRKDFGKRRPGECRPYKSITLSSPTLRVTVLPRMVASKLSAPAEPYGSDSFTRTDFARSNGSSALISTCGMFCPARMR